MNLEQIKSMTVQMIMAFSLPSIIAMVLSSCITIVDGFFIGNYVGEDGIAAVNLGLPILYVYLAVGIMIGVGGVAISGIKLGAGDVEESVRVFNQTATTTLIGTFLLTGLVFILFEPLTHLIPMTSEVAVYFGSYYNLMIFVYPIMMFNAALGMFIRCEGKPQVFMMISILTVVVNMVLDYCFIAYLGLGVEGVAFASLTAVGFGMLSMLYFFKKQSSVFKFRRVAFSMDTFTNTLLNGSSELIGQLSMSISMFAYNWVINRYAGVTGIAAFTIVGYAAYLFNMVIVGFGQGSSPLISFAYGAKEYKLSHKIRKLTNGFVFVAGLVAMGSLLLCIEGYSRAFVANEGVSKLVRSGVGIFAVSFLFTGVNTITSFYFTSIGRAKESALISASRGLVVLLICIGVLPAVLGMTGVWLVAPITEGLTLILSIALIQLSHHGILQYDSDLIS